jgi:methylmalonyl-CoA mutase
LSKYVADIQVIKAANYDIIILETSGISIWYGDYGPFDVSLYVMTPEFGAATQLEKIDAWFCWLGSNKQIDKRGSLDALRCKKQYQRNHNLWDVNLDTLPVFDHCFSV